MKSLIVLILFLSLKAAAASDDVCTPGPGAQPIDPEFQDGMCKSFHEDAKMLCVYNYVLRDHPKDITNKIHRKITMDGYREQMGKELQPECTDAVNALAKGQDE